MKTVTNIMSLTHTSRYQNRGSKATFKISSHIENIMKFIENNNFSAISAQTGSGKTLCIPPNLAKKGYRVRVALPTVVATLSAADFQKQHTNFKVGFAANRDIQYQDDCDIVYATTGHYTSKILTLLKQHGANLSNKAIDFLGDIFIIDEVHTGTTDISLLIGLLRYIIDTYKWDFHPKLLFTSATLNQLDVERYFPIVPTYSVELERLPITHIYAKQDCDPLKTNPISQVFSIIDKELELMDNEGDIWHGIIFRPGVNEVEEMVSALEKRYCNKLFVLPAYSELSHEDLHKIFEDHKCPKIIVGTNIIESSITVDNAGFIIDDGLIKSVFTGDTGGMRLTTCLVSQDAVTQRAGRTARTRSGRAYHLYTKHFHDTKMARHHPLEIERVPIFNVVLSIIDAGLEPTNILRITNGRYLQAMKTLESMGMVIYNNKTPKVTKAGKFVSKVSLGIYNSFLIYKAILRFQSKSDNLDEYTLRTAIGLAIMLETYGPPPFYIPRRNRGEPPCEYQARKDTHMEKYFKRFKGNTEIETLVNLFWIMNNEVYELQCHTNKPFITCVKFWCNDNSMNFKKIKEFYNIYHKVLRSISTYLKDNSLMDDLESPNDTDMHIIHSNILSLFRLSYADNEFTQMTGNKYMRSTDKCISSRNIYKSSSVYSTAHGFFPKIIAAQIVEIQCHYGINRMISLFVPSADT